MILTTIFTLLLAMPLSNHKRLSSTQYTRIAAISLFFAAALSYSSVNIHSTNTLCLSLDAGVGLYSGLLHASTVTQYMETFLFFIGATILLAPWAPSINTGNSTSNENSSYPVQPYSLIALFSVAGSTILLSSSDLLSLFLGIELQSFGVYILASLYRDSESASSAGLKYFLLGAVSSALILLGAGLIYGYTGLTNLDSLFELLSVGQADSDHYSLGVVLGIVLISVGLLFKVAAAPFHYWAPDVYDGVPTTVTTWLTAMPKLAIFVFLLELQSANDSTILSLPAGTNLLIACAFLSLVIGTVLGLAQSRIKRLLSYSTISHVGFMLIALSLSSTESVDALIFYLLQYTVTVVDSFFILLAFGYILQSTLPIYGAGEGSGLAFKGGDVHYVGQLAGQWSSNPVLTVSMAITLFSMAGIPPLVGFFAKYEVLLAAIHTDHYYLAVLAILASVVSAAYYLRVVRVLHFDPNPSYNKSTTAYSEGGVMAELREMGPISAVHAYCIASLTLFIMLFAVNPTLLLNGTNLLALSMHTT